VGDVTRILADIERGDLHAAGQPLSLVYEELRKLAAARVVLEAPGQSLRATALVHEAYLRHVGSDPQEPFDGGGQKRLRIDLDAVLVEPPDDDLLALDEALTAMAREDPVGAALVKFRAFAGLTMAQAAREH